MPATVTVQLDDLVLLLTKAQPLLVSLANRHEPVVGAIDRLGDAAFVASVERLREETAPPAAEKTSGWFLSWQDWLARQNGEATR